MILYFSCSKDEKMETQVWSFNFCSFFIFALSTIPHCSEKKQNKTLRWYNSQMGGKDCYEVWMRPVKVQSDLRRNWEESPLVALTAFLSPTLQCKDPHSSPSLNKATLHCSHEQQPTLWCHGFLPSFKTYLFLPGSYSLGIFLSNWAI